MGEKSRVRFIVIIALILAAAVVYSFSLNPFQDVPGVGLADVDPDPGSRPSDPGLFDDTVLVDVTTDTVQNVVRTLSRYASYRRVISVEYLSGGEVTGALTADVAVDGGWTRSDVTEQNGRVEHCIVFETTRWLWYDDGRDYVRLSVGQGAADLVQRLPTYEDVLELDKEEITGASYEERGGLPCIYVEVYQEELQYRERFWVSVESGLLVAAETVKDGQTVYRMSSYEVESPLVNGKDFFTLPDNTVLHEVGS